MEHCEFVGCVIPAVRVPDALEALGQWWLDPSEAGWEWPALRDVADSSLARTQPRFWTKPRLKTVFEAGRYFVELKEPSTLEKLAAANEDAVNVEFYDIRAEFRDGDVRFWEVLAPFLEEGAEIRYTARNGYRWGYRIQGNRVLKLEAQIQWTPQE